MIISPIVADCIRCFNSEGAVSNNLHDNVLCPEDYQGISSNSRFLKGSSYRARVVDGQSATAVQGDRDGSTLAGAQPPLRCEAQEYFQFGWIIDTLLGDLGRIQGGGISRLNAAQITEQRIDDPAEL